MKASLKYIFIGFVIVALMSISHQSNEAKDAENGLKALEKCSQLYLDLKRFSIDVEYGLFYQNSSFNSPIESEEGLIIRDGQNFYKEEFNYITLLNNNYQINVDGTAEMITLRERLDGEGIPDQINTDSLGVLIDHVEKIADNGYAYFLNTPDVKKMEMFYTPAGYLHTLRTYYRKPIYLNEEEGNVNLVTQIRYTHFDQNPKIDKTTFSEQKYLEILNDGSALPAEEYRQFKVLNYLLMPEGY